ncbi:hypothetical protein CHS0354_007625 [Potamilus streckersoni]|uniref:Uncharacterized protein n=1 Tax=Potamilus streckersoni TaxID=2493646 RepID=A0AAE0T4Z2_9BIVA|nr:hypothetical protein CHS0354_007625 [Potamilus streckersoni]
MYIYEVIEHERIQIVLRFMQKVAGSLQKDFCSHVHYHTCAEALWKDVGCTHCHPSRAHWKCLGSNCSFMPCQILAEHSEFKLYPCAVSNVLVHFVKRLGSKLFFCTFPYIYQNTLDRH